jgi:phage terminase large subunit
MENFSEYDPGDYDFVRAHVSDNPIYAADEGYLKSLRALPSHLRRAFLDGDWEVFAGQYFDRFDHTRHVKRAEQIEFTPWHPRWISIDWGFEHPSAAYWHMAFSKTGDLAENAPNRASRDGEGGGVPPLSAEAPNSTEPLPAGEKAGTGVVTYREFVTRRTPPRELAREIVRRSVMPASAGADSPERIEAIYLSPDAFARRTDEASIAEQMGDIFVATGLPRPTPADDDRIGGWMLMYQMLDAGEWQLTENCIELIRTLPNLVRDQARIEDIEKMDGDDPADAARYGLKSRYATFHGDPHAWRSRMPLTDRIASRAVSPDPTVRALQIRRFAIEERRATGPVRFAHRRR